jgi:hypothetical protein
VGGGIRTLGHWNHNPALYQLSYTHQKDVFIVSGQVEAPQISPVAHSFDFFHNSSTRRLISGDISITSGQGRVKPSPGHLRVASIPIFEP